jgi:hypothetical protein
VDNLWITIKNLWITRRLSPYHKLDCDTMSSCSSSGMSYFGSELVLALFCTQMSISALCFDPLNDSAGGTRVPGILRVSITALKYSSSVVPSQQISTNR